VGGAAAKKSRRVALAEVALSDLAEFRSTVGNVRLLLFWMALNSTLAAFREELALAAT
jgi:hypothetical protein